MFRLINNLTVKQKLLIPIVILFICIQVWLDLRLPDYMSGITVLVQTEGSQMNDILYNGAWMLACALGSFLSTVVVGYILSHLSATLSMNIRKKLFDKVENLAMNEVKKFSTSSLITRTTNDITQIQMFVAMGLQTLIKAPITAVWAITKILNKNWQWSAATGLAVVMLLTVIGIMLVIVIPRFKIVQKLIDNLNNVTRENLTGIRVIRAFNAEEFQINKFENVNNKLTNMQLFNQKVFAFLMPTMETVLNFLTLSIYLLGAIMISQAIMLDKLTLFGDMVVFSMYSMRVIMSFLMLAMICMILPRAQVSANRINEVLDTDISVKDGEVKENTNGEVGTVEFKNVSFKYPDGEDYVIKDISFKANKGDTVAIIGSTGSGKTTLINLIPRFYDCNDGEVLVDGINVKEYKQSYLRNKIGYVSQKAFIFNETIIDNVSYGDNGKGDITEEKVKEAIEVAQGKNFIEDMEESYNTVMAQGGTNVSGGQKQRISIARAIARDPEILIFDDSFSALDYKTDSILRKELKKYTKDTTSIIVAQRIGTIMNADQIIVLDDGEVVGIGKHHDLLQNCEVYKEIALSQLSKEEIENG